MNKKEFLDALHAQIQVLDQKEQQDILDEYALHIDMRVAQGLTEEEAIRDFGSIQELAADILEAYHVDPRYGAAQEAKKKEWKAPDMEKVKQEGEKACAAAGSFLKRAFKAVRRFFRPVVEWLSSFWKRLLWGRQKEMVHTASFVKGKKKRRFGRDKPMRKKGILYGIGALSKTVCRGFTLLIYRLMRLIWNLFWLFMAAVSVLMTGVCLFFFGMLVIWLFSGYPLFGVTLLTLGGILFFGGLSVFLLSFLKRKKTEKPLEQAFVGEKEAADTAWSMNAKKANRDETDGLATKHAAKPTEKNDVVSCSEAANNTAHPLAQAAGTDSDWAETSAVCKEKTDAGISEERTDKNGLRSDETRSAAGISNAERPEESQNGMCKRDRRSVFGISKEEAFHEPARDEQEQRAERKPEEDVSMIEKEPVWYDPKQAAQKGQKEVRHE